MYVLCHNLINFNIAHCTTLLTSRWSGPLFHCKCCKEGWSTTDHKAKWSLDMGLHTDSAQLLPTSPSCITPRYYSYRVHGTGDRDNHGNELIIAAPPFITRHSLIMLHSHSLTSVSILTAVCTPCTIVYYKLNINSIIYSKANHQKKESKLIRWGSNILNI